MLYSTGHNFTRLFRSLFEFLSEFSRNSNDWLKKTHSTVFTDHVTIRELPSSAISHPIQSSTSSLWLASQGPYNYRYSKYYYYHGSCFSATLIHSAFGSPSISRPVHFTPCPFYPFWAQVNNSTVIHKSVRDMLTNKCSMSIPYLQCHVAIVLYY